MMLFPSAPSGLFIRFGFAFCLLVGGGKILMAQSAGLSNVRFYAERLGVADSSWVPQSLDAQLTLPDSIPFYLRPGIFVELSDSSDTRRLHLQMGTTNAGNSLLDEIYALDHSLPVPDGRTLVVTGNRALIQFGVARSDSLFAASDTLHLTLRLENSQGVLSPAQSMTLIK